MRILFSDAKQKSVNLLDVDSGEVSRLVLSSTLRYADFDAHPRIYEGTWETAWVLAVEEDHKDPKPADVKNYVVAINIQTGNVKRFGTGSDFYQYPRFSPDGKTVCWKEWDHPKMPWDGCRLIVADFTVNGILGSKPLSINGADYKGSISEPRWSPNGTLFYCQERTNFRQLCWWNPEQDDETVPITGLETAEMGDASFFIGCQSYVFLSDTDIIAIPTWSGANEIVHIKLPVESSIAGGKLGTSLGGTATVLDTPLKDLRFDSIACLSSTSVLVTGAGYTSPAGVYRITIDPSKLAKPAVTLIRSSTDVAYPETLFSTPIPISFPSRKADPDRTITGFFWPPHNPSFTSPPGSLPSLLISPHGGPTAHTGPGLKLMDQYFLTRGYACFSINYTGSSGHGRSYRQALYGRWGVADTDDVADAVAYLASKDLIDPRKVGVVGGSAGGYNVLQSLVHYPDVFAGGVCYCGVSDVEALDRDTHKMESRYMQVLLGFTEDTTDEEKHKLYKERSPLYQAEKITSPLLLIHGDMDPVVPIAQSYKVKERIEKRGGDVDMIVLKGEGHMFKRGESWETVVREGEKWWRRSLLGKGEGE